MKRIGIPVISESTSELTSELTSEGTITSEDTIVEDTTMIEDASAEHTYAEDTVKAVTDESETEIDETASSNKSGCRGVIGIGPTFIIIATSAFMFFKKKEN